MAFFPRQLGAATSRRPGLTCSPALGPAPTTWVLSHVATPCRVKTFARNVGYPVVLFLGDTPTTWVSSHVATPCRVWLDDWMSVKSTIA